MRNIRDILGDKSKTIYSVNPETTVFESLEKMSAHNVGAMLIMESDQLLGIFTERDYMKKIVLMDRSSKNTVVKDVMTANHIPVVDGFVVSRSRLEEQMESVLDEAEKLAPYPLFTRPANMGSSVGVTKCRSRSDLYEGLLDAARFDRRVLIERGINAREIEVSVLGNDDVQASIPGEIRPEADFYSYDAKYHDDRSELFIPAQLPDETVAQLQSIAIKAYRAIDCAGMARVDFLLDRDSGAFYINEVNTIPGFTQISMYPKLWDASGLPYPKLIDRLIELALERRHERSQTERRYER